ncbi:MAG: 50S ribosomal protein L13, partial [Erysipelotrichaceae bacterium]|nr:50S ribosomal protein L13 [Erysipelotrichaceae bacterium]
MRQTTILKAEDVKKNWYVIDASEKNLGRLATQCATILRGKNKPTFTPNVDCGDNVIVINAAKIVYTGDQEEKKIYYHHT